MQLKMKFVVEPLSFKFGGVSAVWKFVVNNRKLPLVHISIREGSLCHSTEHTTRDSTTHLHSAELVFIATVVDRQGIDEECAGGF